MKLLEFIYKKELISEFAKELARLQKKADKYYYIFKDKEMSDYLLNCADEIKAFSQRLGICNEVYKKAYKIYDFRNSGKKDYILSEKQIEELKNWYDKPIRNS